MANSIDERFEERIEEYKANGYKVLKRNGDSVEMTAYSVGGKRNTNKTGKTNPTALIFAIIGGMLMGLGLMTFILYNASMGFMMLIIGVIFYIPAVILTNNANKVTISITRTGKITEEGNVLKK